MPATNQSAALSNGPTEVTLFDGSRMTIFASVAPFTWTLGIYLQRILPPLSEPNGVTSWFITLHITPVGSQQDVFMSSTVQVLPGQITVVPFPEPGQLTSRSVPPDGFGIERCTTEIRTSFPIPNQIAVKLNVPDDPSAPNARPSVDILTTNVDTSWLIGAMHIVLTDPHLQASSGSTPTA